MNSHSGFQCDSNEKLQCHRISFSPEAYFGYHNNCELIRSSGRPMIHHRAPSGESSSCKTKLKLSISKLVSFKSRGETFDGVFERKADLRSSPVNTGWSSERNLQRDCFRTRKAEWTDKWVAAIPGRYHALLRGMLDFFIPKMNSIAAFRSETIARLPRV